MVAVPPGYVTQSLPACVIIHSLNHPSRKFSLAAYYVLDSVLGAGSEGERRVLPAFAGLLQASDKGFLYPEPHYPLSKPRTHHHGNVCCVYTSVRGGFILAHLMPSLYGQNCRCAIHEITDVSVEGSHYTSLHQPGHTSFRNFGDGPGCLPPDLPSDVPCQSLLGNGSLLPALRHCSLSPLTVPCATCIWSSES